MSNNITRSNLIKSLTVEELTSLQKLLGERIAGHIYDVDKATTFKTPVKKLITITLSTTACRLLVESGAELRDRQKAKSNNL